jgi:hypothetical protein
MLSQKSQPKFQHQGKTRKQFQPKNLNLAFGQKKEPEIQPEREPLTVPPKTPPEIQKT